MSMDLDLKLDFVKIRLAGDHGIGKTAFMTRFLDDTFHPTQVTVDQEVKFKTCSALGETFKVQLIDTAGQERFRTVTSSYYRGAHGIMLTFDLTSKESFEDLQEWLAEVERYTVGGLVKLLVGTKSDLADKRAVTEEEAKAYAKKLGVSYVETSSKDGKNVQEAFDTLLTQIVEKVPEAGRGTNGSSGSSGKGKNAKASVVGSSAGKAKGVVSLGEGGAERKKKKGCTLF
jgi:small GTP-binding protein